MTPEPITDQRDNPFLIGVLLALLAAQIVARYMGSNGGLFTIFYQSLLEPGRFPHDIYLASSALNNASLLWDVARWFHLDFDNDFVGLAVQAVMAAMAMTAVVAMLRRFFGVRSLGTALAVVLLSLFLDNKLLAFTHAGLIYSWTGSPAPFGHYLSFVALYLLLRHRVIAAALVLTAMLAIAVKVAWFPCVIAVVFVFFERSIDRRWLAVFLVPFAYALWKSGQIPLDLAPDEKLLLTRQHIEEYALEYAPHAQPWLAWVLFPASLPLYPWLARRFENASLRLMLWVVFGLCLAVFLVAWVYLGGLHEVIPSPTLVLLGLLRPLKYYQFFLFVMAFVVVLRTSALEWHERLVVLLALVVLRVDGTWVLMAGAVLVGGIALPRLVQAVGGMPVGLQEALGRGRRVPVAWGVAVLVGVLTTYQLVHSSPLATINGPAFAALNKWTMQERFTPEEWQALLALRPREDFPLLVLTPGPVPRLAGPHLVALKSQYIGGMDHLIFDPGKMAELKRRNETLTALLEALKTGLAAPREVLEFLGARGVRLLVPRDLADRFPSGLPTEEIGPSFLLISPGGNAPVIPGGTTRPEG